MNYTSFLFVGALVLGSALMAGAQGYSISWSTIDGGGGSSVGGSFSLNGTVGQHDAGMMTGGSYTLSSGFWSFDDSVPPSLFIARSGTSAVISWTPAVPGFTLQSSTNWAANGWSDAPTGNTNPAALPIQPGARFYRLRR